MIYMMRCYNLGFVIIFVIFYVNSLLHVVMHLLALLTRFDYSYFSLFASLWKELKWFGFFS